MVNRLPGCKVAQPVISEYTGEFLAEPGEVLTKQKALEIEQAGVMKVVVACEDGSELFVISNGMVDAASILPVEFSKEELDAIGINEKVRYSVLNEVIEKCGADKEALLAEMAERCDDLIPKHIIIDDMNLKRKYRDAIKELFKNYNVRYIYVYVEADSIEKNIERRRGHISPDIIKSMINSIEWPTVDEYDFLFKFRN
jgi:uncharacterized protein (DUF1330 family)